jgi:hypothetical protein
VGALVLLLLWVGFVVIVVYLLVEGDEYAVGPKDHLEVDVYPGHMGREDIHPLAGHFGDQTTAQMVISTGEFELGELALEIRDEHLRLLRAPLLRLGFSASVRFVSVLADSPARRTNGSQGKKGQTQEQCSFAVRKERTIKPAGRLA